jgi:hypothetical protein
MSRLRLLQVARTLVAVLLLSWLAPGFAWAALADHHELQHAGGPAEHDHSQGDADHDLAHTSLGHVLGHLPAAPSASSLPALPHAPSAVVALVVGRGASTPPDRLYRPPRLFLG